MQLYMNLFELVPAAQGSLRSPDEQEKLILSLIENIGRRGIREPIVVDRKLQTIKDGKARVLACQKLGIEFVPIILE